MSNTERIYSLYVQANPVPDPDLLPETLDEAELLIIERSPDVDTQQRPEVRDTKRPAGWRTAAVVFAMVIVVVGAVAVVAALIGDDGDEMIAAGDATPTLTFSGEAATYRGPDTFVAGEEVTIILENNSEASVRFGWNRMNDESITLEEEITWMETHRGDTYWIPPWVEDYGGIGFVTSGKVLEESVVFEAGKGLLYAWDSSDKILYPAAHITVTGD